MLPRELIIFLVCVASSRAELEKRSSLDERTKIRDPCKRDVECVAHAFCKLQKYCLCETNYAPNIEKTKCHITIGARCNSSDVHSCGSMSNAECRQNTCTCRDDFMIDINNSSNCILSPKAPGDVCHQTEQCRDVMGMSYCIDNKCRCFTSFSFVNETKTCIKMRGLYESCKEDYECFFDKKYPNEMDCKNGACACRKGQPNCNTGSSLTQSTFLVCSILYFLFL